MMSSVSDEQTIDGVPAPGQVIAGKYLVEAVLGAGGMGVVLAARHEVLGQRVAVKYLLPEIARSHAEAAERFMREARASIELRSEHVARVIDVGKDDRGAAFMVMEFLEGQDLQKVARASGPLAVTDVVEYVLQAADALSEAHELGIVHRDLKPANLFLAAHRDGSPLVKVLDFGISKLSKGERGITRTDAVMGSPGYMSPEQIRSAKHVDLRADIWGLGVVMYELLAGRPPFDGDNIATLSVQIVMETPERLDRVRAEVPVGLADVVARCMAKEPNERFSDMRELADSLLPFASPRAALLAGRIRRVGDKVSVHAATLLASTSAESRTAQGTAGTIAGGRDGSATRRLVLTALGAAALSGFVIWTLLRRPAQAPSSQALSAEVPATTSAPEPPKELPEATSAPKLEVAPAASANALNSADAPPEPSAAKPTALPRRARNAPACPKGQAQSAGHCCPLGLEWLNGRCDRPLATSLP
jgi:tRNA A-37 threonylcarbamoyl transferase component Bud32